MKKYLGPLAIVIYLFALIACNNFNFCWAESGQTKVIAEIKIKLLDGYIVKSTAPKKENCEHCVSCPIDYGAFFNFNYVKDYQNKSIEPKINLPVFLFSWLAFLASFQNEIRAQVFKIPLKYFSANAMHLSPYIVILRI